MMKDENKVIIEYYMHYTSMSSVYSATNSNPRKQSPCRTDNYSTTRVHYHSTSGGKQIHLTPSQPVPLKIYMLYPAYLIFFILSH